MAKSRGVDAKLSRLKALRRDEVTPQFVAEVRQALGDASNLVAAEAAQIVGERVVAELAPDLIAAFDRFMIEPETSDKNCRATTAIVEALNKIEYDQADVFRRGLDHVQLEPVWGGGQDSAGQLRGSSALGLVRINHSGVLNLLADLLADSERVARLAAVQAIAETGNPASVPLLRFKARAGDDDPAVTSECLTALMSLDAAASMAFVSEFLESADESVQEGAALALGESRRPEALAILKDFWPRARATELAEAVLLAISMLRLPAGFDFLLDVLAKESAAAAGAAISALAIHRHNEALRERSAAAVANKGDAAVTAHFAKKFDMKNK